MKVRFTFALLLIFVVSLFSVVPQVQAKPRSQVKPNAHGDCVNSLCTDKLYWNGTVYGAQTTFQLTVPPFGSNPNGYTFHRTLSLYDTTENGDPSFIQIETEENTGFCSGDSNHLYFDTELVLGDGSIPTDGVHCFAAPSGVSNLETRFLASFFDDGGNVGMMLWICTTNVNPCDKINQQYKYYVNTYSTLDLEYETVSMRESLKAQWASNCCGGNGHYLWGVQWTFNEYCTYQLTYCGWNKQTQPQRSDCDMVEGGAGPKGCPNLGRVGQAPNMYWSQYPKDDPGGELRTCTYWVYPTDNSGLAYCNVGS